MILVVGATGTVGREVLSLLQADGGHRIRALTHSTDVGADAPDIDVVQGDLSRPETLKSAFEGVEKVFLSTRMSPELPRLEANAIEAAKEVGVRHIVKLSVIGADADAESLHTNRHGDGEKRIEESGTYWTFIRPSTFMSNARFWASSIKSQGAVYLPAGEGKIGVIHPRDIAKVAVMALTSPGHHGKKYEITGPEPLTTAEQVQAVARAIDKPIKYVDVPPEMAKENMLKSGRSEEQVAGTLAFYSAVRANRLAVKTQVLPEVTGTEPLTMDDWAWENAGIFV